MAKRKGNAAQLDLMDLPEVAHARSTDPQTSHDAAAKITRDLRPLQKIVFDTLQLYGPMIDRKLVTLCRHSSGRTDSTWRTRRAELVAKGLVRPVGKVDGHTVWGINAEAFDAER